MSFGTRVLAGLAWTGGSRLLTQLVAWIVSIVVVRILDPQDYGLLAMAVVVTGFVALFAELGLGWAVVQARELDRRTLRGVFGLVIAVNTVLFGLVFALAPAVSAFFGEARVTDILRVAALQLLVAAPGVIPDALLQRGLEFKRRSLVEASASVVGAAITLALALAGAGVWALVYGSLLAAAWRALGLNLARPFLEWPRFDVSSVGRLFNFGGYVAVSRALLYVYLQADMVIAGRILGKDQLGYYAVAMQLASLPLQRVSAILNEVAFPAFARLQDDRPRLGAYLVGGIGLLAFFSVPVFWGIGAVAPEIVTLFLGEKWHAATLPLQLLALVMPLRMIGQLMAPTLQAVGRARTAALNQLIACCILLAAFSIGARYGIVGLAVSWLAAYPVVFAIQLFTWLPLAGINGRQLLATIGKPGVAGAVMLVAVMGAREAGLDSGAFALVGLVAIGAAAYTGVSMAINPDALRAVRSLIRRGRTIQGTA